MDVRLPDGTVVQNVPDGTTQEELFKRLGMEHPGSPQKSEGSFKPPSWFPGYFHANKPTEADVESGKKVAREVFRGLPADFVAGPLQLVAGLGDVAAAGTARVLGLPQPQALASTEVSKARNLLAGRPGAEPTPMTPIVQSLASTPIVGAKTLGAFVQGAGLGGGLANEGEDRLKEGGLGALGAVLGSYLGGLLGRAAPSSTAQARLDKIATSEGVERTYGMKSGSDLTRNLEARAERNILLGGLGSKNYAQSLHGKIDDQMAKAVWKRAGQNFDEFTQDNINIAARSIGEKLEMPFKGKEIPFDGMKLQTVVDQSLDATYNMTRPDELMKAVLLIDKKLGVGKINASEMNVIADDLRGLATKAYNDNNKAAGDAISKLYSAVREHAISQIPTKQGQEAYRKALVEYANLQTIKDAFVRSADSPRGNLDFTKLKPAIERSMPGGYSTGKANLTDLADLGLSMRGSDVLNEGLKINPVDASIYFLLNNPISRKLRDRSPTTAEDARRLLTAAGLGLGAQ